MVIQSGDHDAEGATNKDSASNRQRRAKGTVRKSSIYPFTQRRNGQEKIGRIHAGDSSIDMAKIYKS